MQTSTSITFFTAIFVALGGALAEELIICCRHVTTESTKMQKSLENLPNGWTDWHQIW